jgi:hypothetical protein
MRYWIESGESIEAGKSLQQVDQDKADSAIFS